jgi:hypothetical protein
MKTRGVGILLAGLCVLIWSCVTDRHPSSDVGRFAIYLLADPEVDAAEASALPIDRLELSEEAILSIDDIVWYDWRNHSFSVGDEALGRLEELGHLRGTTQGVPFVATVGGDRVYLGAFWYGFSSLAPLLPHIVVAPLVLQVQASWSRTEADVRSDVRIRQSLRVAGVLIE